MCWFGVWRLCRAWYCEGSGELNLTRLQLPTEAPSSVHAVRGVDTIMSEQKGNLAQKKVIEGETDSELYT